MLILAVFETTRNRNCWRLFAVEGHIKEFELGLGSVEPIVSLPRRHKGPSLHAHLETFVVRCRSKNGLKQGKRGHVFGRSFTTKRKSVMETGSEGSEPPRSSSIIRRTSPACTLSPDFPLYPSLPPRHLSRPSDVDTHNSIPPSLIFIDTYHPFVLVPVLSRIAVLVQQ